MHSLVLINKAKYNHYENYEKFFNPMYGSDYEL